MFDVLIVGGGMVGASLAVALKPLKLKVGLVEAFAFGSHSQAGYDDRSVALSYGSSLIYQGMGVWGRLQAGVEPIRQIHVSDRGHFGATRLDAAAEGVPALGYVVESRVLGEALFAGLADSAVEVLAPAKVHAFGQTAGHVQVQVERAGNRETLQTRLLVVADGSKSALRGQLGIGVDGHDYGQTAIIANVSTEQAHGNTAYERFTPDGPLALLPLTENRYSLVWTHRTETAAATLALSDAAFLQALQTAFGYRQGRFTKVGQRSSFPLSLMKSSREVEGRALLIGNASHTLHPVAGQGLNLALRDVAVLCDLLAGEVQQTPMDCGKAALLQAYQQARQPDYTRVVGYTDSLIRIFSNDLPLLGHARAGGLLAVDRIAPFRKLLTQQSMGLRFRQARLARGLGVVGHG